MCGKCNNTGRIPLKNYNHGFFNCDCQSPPQDHYHKADPSDFDYAMSDTFRVSSFIYCGVPDPAPDRQLAPSLPIEQVIVHRHSNMSSLESDLLQQTAGKLEHVSKTLVEHLNYRKKTNEGSY